MPTRTTNKKFPIIKKLGSGNFGDVFLVKRTPPSPNWTQAAMKFIQSPGRDALQEVDFLKRQQHPNIIKYLDSFEKNGSLFIVMEYCDLGTLTNFLSKVSAILFKRIICSWHQEMKPPIHQFCNSPIQSAA